MCTTKYLWDGDKNGSRRRITLLCGTEKREFNIIHTIPIYLYYPSMCGVHSI